MGLSRKCQYALRGIFELAKRRGSGPATVRQIASAQEIPPRFLDLIFSELRQGGFIESRRGRKGGYLLRLPPDQLSVGQVIRSIDGSWAPVAGTDEQVPGRPTFHGNRAFVSIWAEVRDVVGKIYDSKTFQDLLDEEQALIDQRGPDYAI